MTERKKLEKAMTDLAAQIQRKKTSLRKKSKYNNPTAIRRSIKQAQTLEETLQDLNNAYLADDAQIDKWKKEYVKQSRKLTQLFVDGPAKVVNYDDVLRTVNARMIGIANKLKESGLTMDEMAEFVNDAMAAEEERKRYEQMDISLLQELLARKENQLNILLQDDPEYDAIAAQMQQRIAFFKAILTSKLPKSMPKPANSIEELRKQLADAKAKDTSGNSDIDNAIYFDLQSKLKSLESTILIPRRPKTIQEHKKEREMEEAKAMQAKNSEEEEEEEDDLPTLQAQLAKQQTILASASARPIAQKHANYLIRTLKAQIAAKMANPYEIKQEVKTTQAQSDDQFYNSMTPAYLEDQLQRKVHEFRKKRNDEQREELLQAIRRIEKHMIAKKMIVIPFMPKPSRMPQIRNELRDARRLLRAAGTPTTKKKFTDAIDVLLKEANEEDSEATDEYDTGEAAEYATESDEELRSLIPSNDDNVGANAEIDSDDEPLVPPPSKKTRKPAVKKSKSKTKSKNNTKKSKTSVKKTSTKKPSKGTMLLPEARIRSLIQFMAANFEQLSDLGDIGISPGFLTTFNDQLYVWIEQVMKNTLVTRQADSSKPKATTVSCDKKTITAQIIQDAIKLTTPLLLENLDVVIKRIAYNPNLLIVEAALTSAMKDLSDQRRLAAEAIAFMRKALFRRAYDFLLVVLRQAQKIGAVRLSVCPAF